VPTIRTLSRQMTIFESLQEAIPELQEGKLAAFMGPTQVRARAAARAAG